MMVMKVATWVLLAHLLCYVPQLLPTLGLVLSLGLSELGSPGLPDWAPSTLQT